ncbi:heavy-metal-associated domain-containing protein [Psychroflexus sp. YR1-1]|uniref:Heavy-metal-associated domain-containing protein n=1 Tax=Psychroflexus aurantiacus TaxID=2709310 RepID=A0A6B3RBU6_9FLAO|nr:heavy-metal-associated domain-containing protein [Psychroflexus aurantiacus]NEV94994.1 heavy-metal-associated domain-containing protein [Psychroflexus aurantiacus]
MRTTVHIQNLKCGGCENTIINRLSEVKNISEAEVNQDDETVSFDYHTKHDFESVKHVLSGIGYPIVGADNELKTKAQSYISCAIGRIKK